MTDTADGVRDARRARHQAIRAEVAQEESEAAEAHVPTSALVRQLLRQAVQAPREQLTEADVEVEVEVESIARRVAHEELHRT